MEQKSVKKKCKCKECKCKTKRKKKKLTEEEFLISAADRFKKMDLNSDGLLKKRELRRIVYEARKKSKMDRQKIKKEPKHFIKQ